MDEKKSILSFIGILLVLRIISAVQLPLITDIINKSHLGIIIDITSLLLFVALVATIIRLILQKRKEGN